MRLKYKTTLVTGLLCMVFAGAIYLSVKRVFEELSHQLVWKYAHVATHYDIETTLQPILDEIEEVSAIARHPNIVSWAENPNDPVYREVAEETLEKFRWRFSDKNFFIVLDKSLAYYFNSVERLRTEDFYRYTLSQASIKDLWYFEHKTERKGLDINVARDEKLGIEKLWINRSIVHNGEFLGVIGTGMEIKPFVNSLIAHHGPGLNTLFVDRNLKVQLHRESGVFQYRPLGKASKSVELKYMLDSPQDYQAIVNLMEQQKRGEEAHTLTVTQGEQNEMVSIHYIAPLDWYELTFVNINSIIDPKLYTTLLYIVAGFVTMLGVLFYLILLKCIQDRLSGLEQKAGIMSLGESPYSDELKSLEHHIDMISHELTSSREAMDTLVEERTNELYQLAMLDPVTGLLNKRGMERELTNELARSKRERNTFGLVWMEVEVASHRYSRVPPDVLIMGAKAITKAIRDYDSASHWDGDEFLILVRSEQSQAISALTERVNSHLEVMAKQANQDKPLTLHVGGVMIAPDTSLQDALTQADSALYLAKSKLSASADILGVRNSYNF